MNEQVAQSAKGMGKIMRMFNNKACFFVQAAVVESGKAVGHAAVVSGQAVAKASKVSAATVVDVSKASKAVVVDARSEHKATKEAKTFRRDSLKAQGL